MNPAPSYSPTDIGLAVVSLLSVLLDVLAAYGVGPTLDAQTRTTLMASLTVLATAGVAFYVANRQGKHAAAAKVSAAAELAASAVPEPPHNVV